MLVFGLVTALCSEAASAETYAAVQKEYRENARLQRAASLEYRSSLALVNAKRDIVAKCVNRNGKANLRGEFNELFDVYNHDVDRFNQDVAALNKAFASLQVEERRELRRKGRNTSGRLIQIVGEMSAKLKSLVAKRESQTKKNQELVNSLEDLDSACKETDSASSSKAMDFLRIVGCIIRGKQCDAR